ncbi:ABC transporter substrate-binding protein [Salibacterium aidingense]|uniref:ABC transporter substrate-binding protein n=1 Tax=Salibacterium aidingense TaxID=384933 RepID=UPI003BC2E083
MVNYLTSRSWFSFLCLAVTFILLLSACGAEENTEEEGENSQDTEETSDETTEESQDSYTVEHAMGTTELEGTPEDIVILTNHGTEALLSLGITPVGAVQSWTGDPWYDHIEEDMEGVEVVGTESQVNLEQIAALDPDLIIGNKMRQEDVYEQLNDIAPTIFEERLRGDWQANFELIAEAVNKEEEGQAVLDEYDQRIADIQEQAGDKLDQEVSVVRFTAGDVRIYQKDSFSGIILDQIGFNRPEPQDEEELAIMEATKEQIPLMEGDVLFHFTYETGDGEATSVQEEWLEDPLFQNLDVVQEGNVHEVSDAIWNTAGGVRAANLMLDDIEEYLAESE